MYANINDTGIIAHIQFENKIMLIIMIYILLCDDNGKDLLQHCFGKKRNKFCGTRDK